MGYEGTCSYINIKKSNDGIVYMHKMKLTTHSHMSIVFEVLYDPNSWGSNTDLYVIGNNDIMHRFTKQEMKTFSTGFCR